MSFFILVSRCTFDFVFSFGPNRIVVTAKYENSSLKIYPSSHSVAYFNYAKQEPKQTPTSLVKEFKRSFQSKHIVKSIPATAILIHKETYGVRADATAICNCTGLYAERNRERIPRPTALLPRA